jgi:preprotein translocase subunit SecA
MGFIERLFRVEERELAKLKKQADQVVLFADEMKSLSDEALQAKTAYFKKLLAEGKTLEDIQYEAFAVAREAATRTLKMTPFPVQTFLMENFLMEIGDPLYQQEI